MPPSERIKPISYLKANAAEIVRRIDQRDEPLIITQNGEAKAVLVDIKSYERTEETLAFLKILALAMEQIEAGKVTPAADVFARIRRRWESS